MTRTETIQLLAVVTCYDNRNAGDGAILAWFEASRRADWTFNEALDAVHAHYAERTDFLMPAHVTRYVRAKRAEEAARNRLPQWCGQCGAEWMDERARANANFRFHLDRDTGERRMCECHPQHPASK